MTPAHRTEVVLSKDGSLSLDQLPFKAGQAVEVIILPLAGVPPLLSALHGTVLQYDRPTDPVADGDWEATQ